MLTNSSLPTFDNASSAQLLCKVSRHKVGNELTSLNSDYRFGFFRTAQIVILILWLTMELPKRGLWMDSDFLYCRQPILSVKVDQKRSKKYMPGTCHYACTMMYQDVRLITAGRYCPFTYILVTITDWTVPHVSTLWRHFDKENVCPARKHSYLRFCS